MPVKNQGAIDSCLETVFLRASARVQPSSLGKGAIVAVIIQNTLTAMDNTANNSQVMVGSASGQPYQMLPGQESPLLYAQDLDDVYIRVQVGGGSAGTPVDVTVIVYKEKVQR